MYADDYIEQPVYSLTPDLGLLKRALLLGWCALVVGQWMVWSNTQNTFATALIIVGGIIGVGAFLR